MYIRSIDPQEYKRTYPLYRTVRIRSSNLEKIKKRAVAYGESVDDIVTRLLENLEGYERRGYDIPEERGTF